MEWFTALMECFFPALVSERRLSEGTMPGLDTGLVRSHDDMRSPPDLVVNEP